MTYAFNPNSPQLQVNALSNESETDEQLGAMQIFAGSMSAMRNPRAHEDDWPPDRDDLTVLDALAFASLLHRILDRCETQLSQPVTS